jgi:ribonucleoside-triphosphate reductase
VWYEISAFDKIAKEAPYHALTNAGHISYVELEGMRAGMSSVRDYRAAMHDAGSATDRSTILWTGIRLRLTTDHRDTCPGCGRHEDEGDYGFERIRRITGYLVGTLDRFNDAKRAEEHDRVNHSTARFGF